MAAQQEPVIRLAILDLGNSPTGKSTAEILSARLSSKSVSIVDRDLTRAAALGNGYQGSLNLTRAEARDLGAALGCEFYVLGDAQIIKRSPSTGEPYFEAYASVFVVSARTGNLISWIRPSYQSAAAESAKELLANGLKDPSIGQRLSAAIHRAYEDEVRQRIIIASSETVIEEAPGDEEAAAANGIQLPRPFRRLKPIYTDEAASADAEATVDVLVDVDEKGEVMHAEIERWAGFGLDQTSLDVVRKLHFFPAKRDGTPIPMRVLLRYNFRKPPRPRELSLNE